MRAHHGEAGIDGATLTLVNLIDGGAHVVVDPAARHTTQRCKRPRVGVEQHLVTLARVRHQPERTARAQLQVRHLHAVIDAADDQAFFAPIELEGLAELEGQWNERGDVDCLSLALAPRSNEVSDGRVPAVVARRLDLSVQRACRAPLVLGPSRIGRQCLLQRCLECTQLVRPCFAPVLRRLDCRCAQPL
ncbi:hypothetical protein D9M68_658450 [compost metagenome]